jgi:hypothetical protein
MLIRWLLALVLLGAVLIGSAESPARAQDCTNRTWNSATMTYTCTDPGSTTPAGPGTDGNSGSNGGATQPQCVLRGDATYCIGTRACWNVPWQVPYKMPDGPKPQPDSKPMVRYCYLPYPQQGPPGVEIYWSDSGNPPPPSLADQAATAVGQLDLAVPALSSSPVHRTLVGLPTWFWVDGAQPTQTGSSAFGLVAIATVRSLHVTTGDGTTLDCPWTTTASQAETDCAHEYTQASYGGTESWQGRPAFAVSAYATWAIRFELNGVAVDIPGAPTTLDGPASTAVLRVDEVQTIVTNAS